MTDVRLNYTALNDWAASVEAKAMLARLGEQVAEDARQAAPKDTGAGAASIGYEVASDSSGAYVRVSWDSDHFYMLFQEVGTSTQSARPFLRPAMTKHRNL